MPDLYEDPDNVDRNPLRDVVKKLEAELKEARTTIATFEKEKRTVTVAELIRAKGLPEKVAGLIPSDADVEQWIEEYGALFGAAPETPATPEPAPAAPEQPATPDPVAEEWARHLSTELTGTPAASPTAADSQLQALIKAAEQGGTDGITTLMRALSQPTAA